MGASAHGNASVQPCGSLARIVCKQWKRAAPSVRHPARPISCLTDDSRGEWSSDIKAQVWSTESEFKTAPSHKVRPVIQLCMKWNRLIDLCCSDGNKSRFRGAVCSISYIRTHACMLRCWLQIMRTPSVMACIRHASNNYHKFLRIKRQR